MKISEAVRGENRTRATIVFSMFLGSNFDGFADHFVIKREARKHHNGMCFSEEPPGPPGPPGKIRENPENPGPRRAGPCGSLKELDGWRRGDELTTPWCCKSTVADIYKYLFIHTFICLCFYLFTYVITYILKIQ